MTTPQLGGRGHALDDLLVIDLSRALAGPHAAMLLGDLGARVIKIEAPGGDDSRGWGPPFVDPREAGEGADGEPRRIESTYFLSANRNKESVVLDLKSTDGRLALEALVSRADVLIENFRTGVMDRLGFSMERLHELNPRLVVGSITGFGHDGPEAGRAGYDQIAQGEAGLMSLTGSGPDEPTKVGVPIGDVLAGMNIAYGVLAALHERERTGRGGVVRTSLLSSIVGVHAFQGTRWTVGGEVGRAAGNHHPSVAPYGLFHTGDGAIQIAVGSQRQWQQFAAELNLDDPRFGSNADRIANSAALQAAIESALAARPTTEWLETFDRIGVPAGKVRALDDVYAWDQTRSQGLVVDVEHATLGTISLPGPAVRFDGDQTTAHVAPPTLGQHTAQVLASLGVELEDTLRGTRLPAHK